MRYLFLLILIVTTSTAIAECNVDLVSSKLNPEIGRLKAGDTYAKDYPSGRQYYSIGFGGSVDNGCLVYYAIEGWDGSNAVSEYISFFYINNNKPILKNTIEMGYSPWKEYRKINFKNRPVVENNVLKIPIRLYAKGDGGCCPTIPSVAIFEFKNNKIVEIRNKQLLLNIIPLSIKGMKFLDARRIILEYGWFAYSNTDDEGNNEVHETVKILNKMGITEVDYCGYKEIFCGFNYRKENNQCLLLITKGMTIKDMVVDTWDFDCN